MLCLGGYGTLAYASGTDAHFLLINTYVNVHIMLKQLGEFRRVEDFIYS